MSVNLKIIINSEDNAFAEDPQSETVNILRDIADKIHQGFTAFTLLDSNGNRCGTVKAEFENEPDEN